MWLGLTRGLAPLNAIQGCIRACSPGDTSPIGEDTVLQELAPLVASFSDLLGRLEQSVHVQKRFVTDAAHQMKVSLTDLRMQAKLAQRKQSPDGLHHMLTHTAGSSDRTAYLVKQLPSLARMENMGATGGMVPLDIYTLLCRVVADRLPKTWAKQVDPGFGEPGSPVTISDNAMMLAEILNNLLGNAIRYTPNDGCVTVRVTAAPLGPLVLIDMDDTGPSIPVAKRERVMQCFYRIPSMQAKGDGLDLAVVHGIVQQHGGNIKMLGNVHQASPWPAGTRFRITLYRASVDKEVSA